MLGRQALRRAAGYGGGVGWWGGGGMRETHYEYLSVPLSNLSKSRSLVSTVTACVQQFVD